MSDLCTQHLLDQALMYLDLIGCELRRLDMSPDNLEVYRLQAKRRIKSAMGADALLEDEAVVLVPSGLPTPEESLSGERSFEMALPTADYMRLRRAGMDMDVEHKRPATPIKG